MTADELKTRFEELRARMEFHDDSEVQWDLLHEAPADILEGGDPDKCAVCGNDIFDDRYHYFFVVTVRDDRFAEQARIYQKMLHKQRREIHKSMTETAKGMLFGTIHGFPGGEKEKDEEK